MAVQALSIDARTNRALAVGIEEDRILRVWTPVLLRTVLTVAVLLMAAGVGRALLAAPMHGDPGLVGGLAPAHTALPMLLSAAIQGDANAMATLGLMVLTLVPLVRVVFCFVLFLKQRSGIFVAFTAYVLAGLIMGIMLGRIG